MLPFYFFSITTNLIMGLILVVFDKTNKNADFTDYEFKYPLLREPIFLLIITIFSGFTAISKMLSPINTNIIIIGDFLPAITGLAGTFVFLNRFLELQSTTNFSVPSFIEIFKDYDEIIGYACISSAIIHLFFYKALFL